MAAVDAEPSVWSSLSHSTSQGTYSHGLSLYVRRIQSLFPTESLHPPYLDIVELGHNIDPPSLFPYMMFCTTSTRRCLLPILPKHKPLGAPLRSIDDDLD